MIKLRERNPLPKRCQKCEEVKRYGIEVCGDCDYCLYRFIRVKTIKVKKKI